MNTQAGMLPNTRSNCVMFICGAIYVGLSVAFINRPGLQYDEVLFSSGALGLDENFVELRWSVAGHQFPLMLMPFIGAIKAYMYKPIFLLFSPSAATVRLPVIIIGLVALILTYLLVRN